MRVMKFGGTSLSTSRRLLAACQLVEAAVREEPVVVVTSAPAGVTNLLLGLVEGPLPENSLSEPSAGHPFLPTALKALEGVFDELVEGLNQDQVGGPSSGLDQIRTGLEYILSEIEGMVSRCARKGDWDPALTDRILGAGERLSSHLLASLLISRGTPAQPMEARDLIRTDSSFGGSTIDPSETTRLLRERLANSDAGPVPVIPGFTGGDASYRTTTLGRGTSDLTASLVGAALSVRVVEIWTDVDGIHAHDPNTRPNSPVLPWLDYEEARRMAKGGARVLHPETLDPLQPLEIPLQVRNTLKPLAGGTWVGPTPAHGPFKPTPLVRPPQSRTPSPVHLFLAGATGQVASSLLEQLKVFGPEYTERTGVDLRIGAALNRGKQVTSRAGFTPAEVAERLDQEGEGSDLEAVVADLVSGQIERPVFVDLTASAEVASTHGSILGASVPVVTANKIGLSGSMADYRRLLASRMAGGVPFRYETTVGAALPVLAAVGERYRSGDDLEAVDAILSGTLAFVFTRLAEGVSFSQAVIEAKRLGFTEPDPREDLLGADVGRKLLILLREAGKTLEPDDISVESLIPPEISHISDSEEFLTSLSEFDNLWTERRTAAKARGERLVYAAKSGGDTRKVGVRSLPEAHPLARLAPTENLVLLRTAHYAESPLAIAGPGAGPGITASGVLSDILSVVQELYGGGSGLFGDLGKAKSKACKPRGRRVA